jgi:membrane associated rhomboid family serine protease
LVRIRGEGGEEALELEEFEARVRRGELAGRCPVNFPPLTGEAWVRADQLDIFRRLHQPRHLYFRRAFNLGRFPLLTTLFVALQVAIFAAMSQQGPLDQGALVAWGAKCRPLIEDLGQLWRLATANLLHENGLHIAFNLFVLFNVGGALENAFRPLDYLLILATSALGASLASLWALPDAVSVGASGIVYGTLGAAVVFGVKYRALLPARYRRILGEATIPTVVVFLYIGFTASGVDNWAHVGGLAAGACSALFMKPRLLEDSAPGGRFVAQRLGPIAAVAIAAALGGAWMRSHPAAGREVGSDQFGVELAVPRSWRTTPGQELGFDNGLAGFGRAAARLAPATGESPEHLLAESISGSLSEVSLTGPSPARLGGVAAERWTGSFKDEDANPVEVELVRGGVGPRSWLLVLEWPAAYPAYRQVLERVRDSVTFVEPRAVREARVRALLDPSPEQFEALSSALSRAGDEKGASLASEEARRRRLPAERIEPVRPGG